MKKTVVLGGLAALVVACSLTLGRGNTDEGQSGLMGEDSPFKGGLVVIDSKRRKGRPVFLENVTVQEFGEQSFLVGTYPVIGHPDTGWLMDRKVWFAIDDVSIIAEYSDVDEYKEVNSTHR